jgi:hypothetical protein
MPEATKKVSVESQLVYARDDLAKVIGKVNRKG